MNVIENNVIHSSNMYDKKVGIRNIREYYSSNSKEIWIFCKVKIYFKHMCTGMSIGLLLRY